MPPLTGDTTSRRQLLRFLQKKSDRIVSSYQQFPVLMNQNIGEFSDIFLATESESFYVFSDFNIAFDYGKRVARHLGFEIRIKTSSNNNRQSIIYKYVACTREGDSQASGSKIRSDSDKASSSRSIRCGCPWICKLIGIGVETRDGKIVLECKDASSGKASNQPRIDRSSQYHTTLWYWNYASQNRVLLHNHDVGISAMSIPSSMVGSPLEASSMTMRTPISDTGLSTAQMSIMAAEREHRTMAMYHPERLNLNPLQTASRMQPVEPIISPKFRFRGTSLGQYELKWEYAGPGNSCR